MEALGEAHQVRIALGIVLSSFDLDAGGALALPRAFQLRDHHGLLELRHGAEDLANEDRSGPLRDPTTRSEGVHFPRRAYDADGYHYRLFGVRSVFGRRSRAVLKSEKVRLT